MDMTATDASRKEISCRITRTLLLYLKEVDSIAAETFLHGLPLNESYLMDMDNWVSHAFLQVLYHRMIDTLADDNAVYKMTLASGRFHSLGILDRIVRLLGSPKLIYTQAPRYNKLLKMIGDVFVHEIEDGMVLLEDRYRKGFVKTQFDCDYTRGILAGIPTLFGMPEAEVEEIECQVTPDGNDRRFWKDSPEQGCSGCLYRVRWDPNAGYGFWRRLFYRRRLYRQAIQDLTGANRKIQDKYEEVKQLAENLEQVNRQLRVSKQELEIKQEELRDSEQRYKLLADNVSDNLWIYRLDTRSFDYFSPSVTRTRGYTPEEAVALTLEETLAPASLKKVLRVLKKSLDLEKESNADPDRAGTIELQHCCKNGTYAWTEATMSFIRDKTGKPIGIMGVSRDIAARKAAEEKAGELADQLERAQKMEAVGNMAAGVAHDLNNILSGLVSYPDILLMEVAEDSPLREGIRIIKQSGQKAAAIVQDLLTLSRRGIEVKKIFNLNGSITEYLVSPEYNDLRQNHSRVTVATELADDLLNVAGSPAHMANIVMNLVSNAAEAMPAGGRVVIETANTYLDRAVNGYETVPEGEFVRLTVADEGIGITPEDLQNIFEPFYSKKRLHRSGSGLGMTVVWTTVKDHNGFIDVSSVEGEGTKIMIYLPAKRDALEHSTSKVVIDDYVGNEAVLIVDDAANQRHIAVKMLSKLGYRATAVASGEEAVAYLKEHTADLLVLDMVMHPGIDGLETFRRIIPDHPGQKAIIASGYSESYRVKELQKLGAGEYVRKPYTLEKIGMAVRRELDGGPSVENGE